MSAQDIPILHRFRGRIPLLAFILLALVCVILLGFACACLSSHPVQALEQAAVALAALPGLVEASVALAASLVLLVTASTTARARAPTPAPAFLQRFLF